MYSIEVQYMSCVYMSFFRLLKIFRFIECIKNELLRMSILNQINCSQLNWYKFELH